MFRPSFEKLKCRQKIKQTKKEGQSITRRADIIMKRERTAALKGDTGGREGAVISTHVNPAAKVSVCQSVFAYVPVGLASSVLTADGKIARYVEVKSKTRA